MDFVSDPFNSCIDIVNQAANNLGSNQHLDVDCFRLNISANENEHIEWAKAYLYPLALPASLDKNKKCRFTIKCMNSDKIVSQIISMFDNTGNKENFFKGYSNRNMLSWESSNGKQICFSPVEGIIWVCDSLSNTLTIIYSSRTRWPSLEFARTIRDVITHLLVGDGWLICHAGAVKTDKENIMIIGGAGAGKTTLILALLNNCARYNANELLFAKPENGNIKVLPFAIPIAIGMGTVLQFDQIIELIEKPYNFLYPPRRLDMVNLAKSSRKKWLKMNDKLQLLASELTSIFPLSKPVGQLNVDRIIVPKISMNSIKQTSSALNSDDIENIFINNLISSKSKKFTAPWLKISSKSRPKDTVNQLLDKIRTLPAIKLHYHVNKNNNKISL